MIKVGRTVSFSAHITPEVKAGFERLARATGRSMSKLASDLIEQAVREAGYTTNPEPPAGSVPLPLVGQDAS